MSGNMLLQSNCKVYHSVPVHHIGVHNLREVMMNYHSYVNIGVKLIAQYGPSLLTLKLDHGSH